MRLAVLGSTGSVGTQTLDVAEKNGYSVTGIAANTDWAAVERQIRRFRPLTAAMCSESAAAELRIRTADCPTRVYGGRQAVAELAGSPESDAVVNAISGIDGLEPTMAALGAGKRLALSNKESLVAGGKLVTDAARASGAELIPVDSEHSAIFQSIGASPNPVKKIILTASGGPFFGKKRSELESVTVDQALLHPTWSMGRKITVDCANLMNKGLELIEAAVLFGVGADRIEIVIHPQSILHSAVMFSDNSVIGQMGRADMRLPIQYALSYPERAEPVGEPLDLAEIGKLTFYRPDFETFRAPLLCRAAFEAGGTAPAALNGANEAAVELFLAGKINFPAIAELVEKALSDMRPVPLRSAAGALEADREARSRVYACV